MNTFAPVKVIHDIPCKFPTAYFVGLCALPAILLQLGENFSV
jgi:hypothetical protein